MNNTGDVPICPMLVFMSLFRGHVDNRCQPFTIPREMWERKKNDQTWYSLIFFFFFIPVNYFFATCPDSICDCPPARHVTGRLRQREEKKMLERKIFLKSCRQVQYFFQPRFRISHQSTYFSFLFFYSSASSIRSNRSVTQHL